MKVVYNPVKRLAISSLWNLKKITVIWYEPEIKMFLKQWVECSSILGVGSGTVYTVPLRCDGTTLYPQHSCKKTIVSQGRLSAAQNWSKYSEAPRSFPCFENNGNE